MQVWGYLILRTCNVDFIKKVRGILFSSSWRGSWRRHWLATSWEKANNQNEFVAWCKWSGIDRRWRHFDIYLLRMRSLYLSICTSYIGEQHRSKNVTPNTGKKNLVWVTYLTKIGPCHNRLTNTKFGQACHSHRWVTNWLKLCSTWVVNLSSYIYIADRIPSSTYLI